jgi:glycosyltransferase involved in cell wall biosynthesis
MTAGGAERVMSIMANHWADKGRAVTLITADDGSSPPFYALRPHVAHVALGVLRKSRNPFQAIRNNFRYVLRLRRAIQESRPDVVVSFITECNIRTLLATIGLPVPVVVSERNDPRRYQIGKVRQLLRKWLYARARCVVAQTQEAKEYFPPTLRERISVIPNPVLEPGEEARAADAAHPPTVVSIGRLVAQKGFDVLIRAFAQISEEHPGWRLKIIGEGPLRRQLEDEAQRLGVARWEGFPNALCEAMALGLPVVATSCSAGPTEIVQDGVNGLLVPVDDELALGAAMDKLMADEELRRRLGSSAVEVTKRYGVERVMQHWESVLFSPREVSA